MEYATRQRRCQMARTEKSLLITHGRALTDLGVAVVEAVEQAGGTDVDARRIFEDKILRQRIGLLVMEKGSPCQKNVPNLIPDFAKEVVDDVEPTQFDPRKLKFLSFLRDGDNGRINGPMLRKRAKEMKANLGLSDMPALRGKDGKGLETIPAELRAHAYIVLTGTVLRTSDGDLIVPCLIWCHHVWALGFRRLDEEVGEGGLLVACE
ncbi:MAG: hypothetical protein V1848_02530 [Candidatus Magasanikbacteria bacterium]